MHNVSFRDIKLWVAGEADNDGRVDDAGEGDASGSEGAEDFTDLCIEVRVAVLHQRSERASGRLGDLCLRAPMPRVSLESAAQHAMPTSSGAGFHLPRSAEEQGQDTRR